MRDPALSPAREAHVARPGAIEAAADPIAGLVTDLLGELGEDSGREGLVRTPDRVARSLRFLCSGYDQSLEEVVNGAVFEEDYSEIVAVTDIELYSLCEHHLLPFYGQAHVAYLPRGRIVGLSKLPRIVDVFARRLQVQERLTTQIAEALDDCLRPLGVAVVIEASHLCMMMRGVEKQNSRTITSCLLGAFRDEEKTRAELFGLLRRAG